MIPMKSSSSRVALLARRRSWVPLAVLVAACGGAEPEEQTEGSPATPGTSIAEREAQVASNPLRDAYFGELHIHTAYSLDAYIFGNTLNDPFVAYRFAKGEEVAMPGGGTKRIGRPLDFTAITDHAEALGEYQLCTTSESTMYDSDACAGVRRGDMQIYADIFAGVAQMPAQRYAGICGDDGTLCEAAAPSAWERVQEAAAQYYEPGTFTTLVAYEYSSNAPEGQGGMMHRNVIFGTDDVPETVFSAFEGTPEDLHAWLEVNCTGECRVLTIPHNPNFYWGRLYWGRNADGSEWTPEQVERRARLDRLVEIMQVKGNSECQLGIGTTDEACNFELVFEECPAGENAGCNDFNSFVRNGLKLGLRYEDELGINPFKQGIIASTDNHNGTPSDTDESSFMGHYATNDADPEVRLGLRANPTAEAMGMSGDDDPTRLYNPGGIAGVWANRNTREAIWEALYRRETFGTSGTRTKIRMFGGFGLPEALHERSDWVEVGYAQGVPQGGDLPMGDGSPTFTLWAQRDPASAPLARLQIIKGWMTTDGELMERTYDVACSEGTPSDLDAWCPDNGATVNLEDCSISQGVGAPELAATWTDPDFDPAERAFYYARVLENPVCRWSMYDAVAAGVEHPADLPATVRERAWSSPIWYGPR